MKFFIILIMLAAQTFAGNDKPIDRQAKQSGKRLCERNAGSYDEDNNTCVVEMGYQACVDRGGEILRRTWVSDSENVDTQSNQTQTPSSDAPFGGEVNPALINCMRNAPNYILAAISGSTPDPSSSNESVDDQCSSLRPVVYCKICLGGTIPNKAGKCDYAEDIFGCDEWNKSNAYFRKSCINSAGAVKASGRCPQLQAVVNDEEMRNKCDPASPDRQDCKKVGDYVKTAINLTNQGRTQSCVGELILCSANIVCNGNELKSIACKASSDDACPAPKECAGDPIVRDFAEGGNETPEGYNSSNNSATSE